jgi:hypothetical protein
MYRKLILATLGFILTCNLALAETTTFKALENNVYDVYELTKMGSDYTAFSSHATELGLTLGRYKRELNGKELDVYESLIVEAADRYVKALDRWRISLSPGGSDQSSKELISEINVTLRDNDIKQAAKKITEAEAIKKSQKR